MQKVKISDMTLCFTQNLSFKEKIEIVRLLVQCGLNVIELPRLLGKKVDSLLINTIATSLNNTALSVTVNSKEDIDDIAPALKNLKNPQIKIEIPLSTAGMEYKLHAKADKIPLYIQEIVKYAKTVVNTVEFSITDATRSDPELLIKCVNIAKEFGASYVSLSDTAADLLPDDFAQFAAKIKKACDIPVFVCCQNVHGMATAGAVLSVKYGVDGVKTSACDDITPFGKFASFLKDNGNTFKVSSDLSYVNVGKLSAQIKRIVDNESQSEIKSDDISYDNQLSLNENDDIKTVGEVAAKLGYELSPEDLQKVYREFLRVASKKPVGVKEIDSIIASSAMQVPETYMLESYIINTGNIVNASAQITLKKGQKLLKGIAIGDGPIDAAFLSVEQIIGRHFELDDFSIQSITRGHEAVGNTIVKLRSNGKLYSGNGVSTDILGASIRAYLNAVNKIIYEETE